MRKAKGLGVVVTDAAPKAIGPYSQAIMTDGLVFTAGIGEHAASIRANVCQRLAWLGITLDAAANAAHGPRISAAGSRASAWVIATDEEAMVARHTLAVLRR